MRVFDPISVLAAAADGGEGGWGAGSRGVHVCLYVCRTRMTIRVPIRMPYKRDTLDGAGMGWYACMPLCLPYTNDYTCAHTYAL